MFIFHLICIAVLCFAMSVSTTRIPASSNDAGENNDKGVALLCNGLPKMAVLPGRGWDNLRNKDMGQVTAINYKQCKTTPDGRYLIPDNVVLIPLKQSDVELFSEVIDSWSNYTSVTSRSFNLDLGVDAPSFSISGSFSSDYQSTKKRQVDEKATTFRVHARYTMYVVVTIPTTDLDTQFQTLLFSAIHALESNNTDKADFILELIVRDYGTHLITRIDAGAVVMEEDFISRQFIASVTETANTLKAAASASFFSIFKFDPSYTHTVSEALMQGYTASTTSSHVVTYGGAFFRPNDSVSNWVATVPDNLAGIDRRGVPLNFVITPYALPNVSLGMLDKLQTHLMNATSKYYAFNEHRGCMKMESPNFDFNANVDNNQCNDPYNNYTFGGIFQTCEGNWCAEQNLQLRNPLTGDFSCSSMYVAVPLRTSGMSRTDCHESCHGWWVFKSCDTYCNTMSAQYNAYWCAALGNVPRDTGVMFGGIYTSKLENPVTHSRTCPATFMDLVFLQDLHVCIGTDYELGRKYAVDFGGFFSCQYGNPLYTQLKKVFSRLNSNGNEYVLACPAGYTQHPAIINQDCLVHYCVEANSFSTHGELPVVLPPFLSLHNLYVETVTTPDISGDSHWLSGGAIAAIVIGSVLVIGGIIFGAWRYKKTRRQRQLPAEGYAPIPDGEPGPSVN